MSANEKHIGKKILVIDDNRVIQKVICSNLKSQGFEVMEALDGSEVVACLHTQRPDLILLDLMFPPNPAQGSTIWDGLNILEWLRNMGNAGDIPFIVVSGANPDKYKSRCLAAGASAYFSKPVPIAQLIACIHAALDLPPKKAPQPETNTVPDVHLIAA